MTKLEPTVEAVRGLLERLPDSADEIAALFKEKEIYGDVADGDSCPLHNYLCHEIGCAGIDLGVTDGEVYMRLHSTCCEVRLPNAAKEFVRNFDNRVYPDLVATDDADDWLDA